MGDSNENDVIYNGSKRRTWRDEKNRSEVYGRFQKNANLNLL